MKIDKRVLAIATAGGTAASILVLGAFALQTQSVGAPAEAPAAASNGTKLFRIEGDKVIIPEAEEGETTTSELLRISAGDFEKPAHVYRERLYVFAQGVVSKPVFIPSVARQMIIVARGDSAEDLFPKLEVSIIEENEDSNNNPIVLFSGFVQSHTLRPITLDVMEITGTRVRIKLRLLNPYDVHDGVNLLVSHIAIK